MNIFRAKSSADRRLVRRISVPVVVYLNLGRSRGKLLDIGPGGAKVRLTSAVKRSEVLRLQCRFRSLEILAPVRVLSSSIVTLAGSATEYDARVAFDGVPAETAAAIRELMEEVERMQEQTWVRNVEGKTPVPHTPTKPIDYFLRLTRTKQGWEEVRTTDREQPHEGLTVPASTTVEEAAVLARTYDAADAEGRRLMRIMAEAVLRKT